MTSDERYLNIRELALRFGCHRNTIFNWVRDGAFPKPVKLGCLSRWALSDVLEWETARRGEAGNVCDD
jgi:prophage regulatory protein